MEDIRKNILYMCYSEDNAEEYANMSSYFPFMYWGQVYRTIIIPVLFIVSFLGIEMNRTEFILSIVLVIALHLWGCKIGLKTSYKNAYIRMQNRCPGDTEFLNEFYEDYFIMRGEHVIRKTEYSKIRQIVETNINIYLYDGVRVFILQKEKCKDDLITFLKEKCGKNGKYKDKVEVYAYNEINQGHE